MYILCINVETIDGYIDLSHLGNIAIGYEYIGTRTNYKIIDSMFGSISDKFKFIHTNDTVPHVNSYFLHTDNDCDLTNEQILWLKLTYSVNSIYKLTKV